MVRQGWGREERRGQCLNPEPDPAPIASFDRVDGVEQGRLSRREVVGRSDKVVSGQYGQYEQGPFGPHSHPEGSGLGSQQLRRGASPASDRKSSEKTTPTPSSVRIGSRGSGVAHCCGAKPGKAHDGQRPHIDD